MRAGNPFRITRLQGALLGSFFLHAVVFYGLSQSGNSVQVSSIPKRVVLQVELLAAAPELTLPTPNALEPIPVDTNAKQLAPAAISEAPKEPAKQSNSNANARVLPWNPQEPKVQKFPDLEYPPDTLNITATLEIEVTLDKEGKATAVRVISESPQSMFTEWAWEMGMKGVYTPKITADGPSASTLKIRLDITPGMSVEVH